MAGYSCQYGKGHAYQRDIDRAITDRQENRFGTLENVIGELNMRSVPWWDDFIKKNRAEDVRRRAEHTKWLRKSERDAKTHWSTENLIFHFEELLKDGETDRAERAMRVLRCALNWRSR